MQNAPIQLYSNHQVFLKESLTSKVLRRSTPLGLTSESTVEFYSLKWVLDVLVTGPKWKTLYMKLVIPSLSPVFTFYEGISSKLQIECLMSEWMRLLEPILQDWVNINERWGWWCSFMSIITVLHNNNNNNNSHFVLLHWQIKYHTANEYIKLK